MNKTQRLQQWFEARPRWDHASYGEFMHVGANQTLFRVALKGQEITKDMVILDTACGVGGNARWLASLYGCRVFGNDIDADAIQVAKDLAEIEEIAHLCEFVTAPADELGFEDESFDIVVSTEGVFDIAEIKRVLKPGGKFVVSMLFDNPKATFELLTEEWGLEMEDGHDVTGLAFAFHRAKEEEARLLVEAEMLHPKELVQVINENIAPYAAKAGRHFLMRLRKTA